ncbi:ABC transporter ATP-binding protein [Isachenkonia alkalipeptolytica]|uniref:ABC transporter ATP-binding protein n=1 Tax=Isachenkonia alkalipeptolytica TaxID=2565777 RepID=A0AA43XKC6_9CLOT|nr:ABC transporter ATP-binding protein [Isachenkonia alkalipeptolytica]NBG87906.1 ABC transporter ATP-binding protein [Isachenkonia alkalipeptolytica]
MSNYHEEETLGKAYDSKLMARLLGYAKPYWKIIALCVLLLVFIAGVELARPYFIQVAIDEHINVYDRPLYVYDEPVTEGGTEYDGHYYYIEDPEEGYDSMAQLVRIEGEIYLLDEFLGNVDVPGTFQSGNGDYLVFEDREISASLLSDEAIQDFRAEDISNLWRIGWIFLALIISAFIMNYIQVYALNYASNKIIYNIRQQLFTHVENMSLRFFDKNPVGRLVTRITNDTETLHQMYTEVLVSFFKDIFILLGVVIVMLTMSFRLALLTFLVLPVLLLSSYLFRLKVRDAYRQVRLKLARINASLSENFTGMKTIQTFKRETQQFNKFNKTNEELLAANKREVFIFAVYRPSMEIIRSLGFAIIIWYGGGQVVQGNIQFGILFAFINYIKQFFQPINNLTEKYNVLQSSMASSERIFKLLDTESTIQNPENPKPLKFFRGEIEFKNVWFAYNEDEWVLKDVSFKIKPGDSIAFVGATGAGKSSIINLMARFYDIQKGEILIDGVNIKDLSITDLRENIGIVLQDVFMFAGDIKGNISLDNPNISREKIKEIAKYVNLHRFIERLPNGYDEPVMERGATLSSGQKQLLAFARALAFNPAVLVLDEATSNIDTETEELVQDAMQKIIKGKTTIAIAHRLSTIQSCDKIIVLHKGRIREIGNHNQLLKEKGLYYNLYELQYKDVR